uniref:Uncharacterized protein n=1 Tax=Meloidogyne javanica TaxID=6303 RepID=A0A915MWS1_MELJA
MTDSTTSTSENSFNGDSADLQLNLNNYRKRKRSLIDEMDQTNLQMQLIKDKCDLKILYFMLPVGVTLRLQRIRVKHRMLSVKRFSRFLKGKTLDTQRSTQTSL